MEIEQLPDRDGLIVAVDTEGSGLFADDGARLSVVSIAYDNDGPVEAVYAFDHGYHSPLGPKYIPSKYPGPSLFDDTSINLTIDDWHALCQWLQRQRLVLHNSIHDLAMFNAGLRNTPGTGYDLGQAMVWDTMVVAPLLWPNERVGLDAIGVRVFQAGKGDALEAIQEWKRKYLGVGNKGRYDLIPDELLIPYAGQDASMTLALFVRENQLIDEGLVEWQAVQREIELARSLYYAERAGVGFDVPKCLAEDAKLAAIEDGILQQFAANGLANPTEDSMRRYWFGDPRSGGLGLEPVELTESGKPAVTVAAVRELAAQRIRGAVAWQKLSKVRTARSMWYSAWPRLAGPDSRLRTRFRQTKSESDMRSASGGNMKGTVSGRLAVERIQLQAIPHDYQIPEGILPIREMWTAKPGFVVVEIDVSQAEMRGVAGLSQCTGLLDNFAAGHDAHTATCRLVFSMEADHPDWDFHRQIAKRLNFAIVYGAGIDTLVAQIKTFTGAVVGRPEAEGWWTSAKQAMPEVFRLSRSMQRRAEATGMVELVGGKTRHFRVGEFTHKAMNALIQGSVSVAMADSMIKIDHEFGYGHTLLQIHDSVVLELPIPEAEAMRKRAQHIIESTFEGHFRAPFRSDWKAWTHD